MDLTPKVCEILKAILETENISNNANLIALGFDSIMAINLIVQLEEAFDVIFDDNELLIGNFSTISQIVERVESKLARP
jgi:acyl carrier protein